MERSESVDFFNVSFKGFENFYRSLFKLDSKIDQLIYKSIYIGNNTLMFTFRF